MKKRRFSFWLALLFSTLLHVTVMVADLLQEWFWLPDQEEAVVRNTKKKLKSQSLDDPLELALPKVKPAEMLTVTLQQAVRGGASQKPDAAPARPKKKKPPPNALPVKKPELVASAPVNLPGPTQLAASEVAVAVAEAASSPAPVPVLVASAVTASQPAVAKKPGYSGLSRFPRDVKITYRGSIYVADMHWHVEDGKYNLSVEGSSAGMFYRYFQSRGRIDRDGVYPDQFVEYRERNHQTPKYQVDFDYINKTVEVGEPGKRKIEPMGEGDFDIFAAAFHLALTGADENESKMSVYTGRRGYKDVQFKVAGESTLSLSDQDVEAVLLRGRWEDRRFEFWLAPQWHNIPVRMNVVVPEYGSFEFNAQDITLDGKTVLKWAPTASPD